METKSVKDALIDLIATYYVFDLSYTNNTAAFLLLFQHHVFSLKDDQALPQAAAKLVGTLDKV